MDEPTAAVSSQEAERLFGVIAELKRRDCAIVYVSHRIDEVLRISDRITVLRDGVNERADSGRWRHQSAPDRTHDRSRGV